MSKRSKMFNFLKGGKTAPAKDAEKVKTVAELQQEYSNLCARLGDNVYQAYLKEQEAELLLSALRKVNQDGAEAQSREAKAAAEAKPEAPTTEEKANV